MESLYGQHLWKSLGHSWYALMLNNKINEQIKRIFKTNDVEFLKVISQFYIFYAIEFE